MSEQQNVFDFEIRIRIYLISLILKPEAKVAIHFNLQAYQNGRKKL